MNAGARVMSVMKEKDLLSDLLLRQCEASAAPSEASGNRCDASPIKVFQLAKLALFLISTLAAAEVMKKNVPR